MDKSKHGRTQKLLAEQEQVQARQVEAAVDRAEHYRGLLAKFGPRQPHAETVNSETERAKQAR